MKTAIILILMMFALIPVSMASICEDQRDITQNCTMLTPTMDCASYTYTVINLEGNEAQAGSLAQLNETIYQFNLTVPAGDYIIRLCDNSTREIRVLKTDAEIKMIGSIIGLVFIIAFFVWLGYATDRKWWAARFIAFGIALIELMILLGVMYGSEAGIDFTELMRVNFYAMLIIGFGFGMVALFLHSVKAGTAETETEQNSQVGRWGRKKWRE